MKTSKKILAMLLAIVMVMGMLSLSGCKAKQKEPQELFMNALQMYKDAIEKNEVVKLMNKASTNGSVSVGAQIYPTSALGDIDMNLTTYMDQANNATSMVVNLKVGEKTYDAQLLLSDKKFILASTLLENAYGIDLNSAVKNFPTSIFGTKGDNIFNLTEEDEKEALKLLEGLVDSMKSTPSDVNLDKTVDDLFVKYAKFAADYDVESDVRGENVKSNVVHATMTKTALKSMVNEMIDIMGAKETVNDLLKTYNEMANVEGMLEEDIKEFKSINDVIDNMFDKHQDGENVISIDMILDTKHDAIMAMTATVGTDTVKMVVGKNPREIKQVDISITADGKTNKLTLTIDEGSTANKYQLIDESQDGIVITIDKAHKKVTLASVNEGNVDEENVYSFSYNLTDNELALTFHDEETKMNLTVTIKANDKSPVKHTEFKDFLTMSAEDMESLLTELQSYLEEYFPSEPEYDEDLDDEWESEWDDEWTDLENPEYDEDLEIDWDGLQTA